MSEPKFTPGTESYARLIAAAPEMYELLRQTVHESELFYADDCSACGEKPRDGHLEACPVGQAKPLLARIDGGAA